MEGFIWDVVFPIFCVLHTWRPPWTPKGLPRGQFQWGKSNPSSLGWRNTTKLLLPHIPRPFLCSTTVRWQRNKKKKSPDRERWINETISHWWVSIHIYGILARMSISQGFPAPGAHGRAAGQHRRVQGLCCAFLISGCLLKDYISGVFLRIREY